MRRSLLKVAEAGKRISALEREVKRLHVCPACGFLESRK